MKYPHDDHYVDHFYKFEQKRKCKNGVRWFLIAVIITLAVVWVIGAAICKYQQG